MRTRGTCIAWRTAARPAALAAVLVVLAGCTLQPTPYQPLAESGGYEETQLGQRVYRVSFRGNRATAETDVLDYLFLRCAELTHQAGYHSFVIQEDFGRTGLTTRNVGPRTSVGMGVGFGNSRSFWGLGFGAPISEPEYEAAVSYHLAVFVIRMLTPEEAKSAEGQVYDADFLLRSLEPKKEASQHPAS